MRLERNSPVRPTPGCWSACARGHGRMGVLQDVLKDAMRDYLEGNRTASPRSCPTTGPS